MARRARDRGARGEDVVPPLHDGATMGEIFFREAVGSSFDYLVLEVLGERFERLGLAVGQVIRRYEVNSDGMFLDLRYLGTNNPYYRWYIENEGRAGGLPRDAYHHVCRRHASRCSHNFGLKDVIHIQKWAPVSRATASDVLESWGLGKLLPERAREGDTKDALVPDSRAGKRSGVQALPAPKFEEPEAEDDGEDPGGVEAARPVTKKRKKGLPKPAQEAAALDAMLDDGLDSVGEVKDNKVEKKLGVLRAKLLGKKEEARSRGPGSVLAGRAVEAAEKTKPKKPKQTNVVRNLQKALLGKHRSRGSKEPESSEDSDEEADDEEEDLDLSGSSGWEQRRKKLRKIAEERPGKLLLSGLQSMNDQLGQITGDDSTEAMSPIMVRYLLTMVLPTHPLKTMGEAKYRELRTLCQALDALLKGKVDAAGDLLMQRFKSLVMSLRDNSDKFGRYLELIPEEMIGVSPEETYYARELAHKTAKAEKLLC